MGTFDGTAILAYGCVISHEEFEIAMDKLFETSGEIIDDIYEFEEYFTASLETEYPFVNVKTLYSGLLFYADGTKSTALAECSTQERIIRPIATSIPDGDREKFIAQLTLLCNKLGIATERKLNWILIAQCNGPC